MTRTASAISPRPQSIKDTALVLTNRPLQAGTRRAATSRFGDDVWHLAPAIHQRHQRALHLDFTTLPGCFQPVAKELFYCMLVVDLPPGEQPLKIDTIRTAFSTVKAFLTWAAELGTTTLRELTPQDLGAYHTLLTQQRLTVASRSKKLLAARYFWLYRDKLTHDHLSFDSSDTSDSLQPRRRARSSENTTDRVPEQVIGPLLTWAIRWVTDFSDDIVRAHHEWSALHANTHLNRRRAGHPLTSVHPDQLRALLERYRAENRRLPVARPIPGAFCSTGPNRAHLARELGCAPSTLGGKAAQALLQEAVADLGLADDTYLRTEIRGQLEDRPWRTGIAYEDIAGLERLLHAASYIVISYLSGMRDSEVKHLQRGCLALAKDDTGRTYRRTVTSQAFKGEGTPLGVGATWIVGQPVERAVAVLQQLQPPTSPYLFSALPSSRKYHQKRSNEVKTTNQTIEDLKYFVEWINNYTSRHDRDDGVPLVNGAQWKLTTRQFRRTLAWFIARRPGGAIAGAIQYRHQKVQMFEGYAGTTESGFRHEVEAEESIARGEKLIDTVTRGEHRTLTGPAAAEAEHRLDEFQRHITFDGKVVTDPARIKRLMDRHEPDIHHGTYVTCIHNRERALCHRGDDTGPELRKCKPLLCRNVALTDSNRAAHAAYLADLDHTLAAADRLPPYLHTRLHHQRIQIVEFLATHAPDTSR